MGFVSDGGLYVFEVWLYLSSDEIRVLWGKFYVDVVFVVMLLFVGGEFENVMFRKMIEEVYVIFYYFVVMFLV